MDLSNSELIDAGLETPVNKENLTEDEKLLMEKDEKINASEPWSAERSVLLQEAVQFHQDKLIEEIKELENEINNKKATFWKMEGSKDFLKTVVDE